MTMGGVLSWTRSVGRWLSVGVVTLVSDDKGDGGRSEGGGEEGGVWPAAEEVYGGFWMLR